MVLQLTTSQKPRQASGAYKADGDFFRGSLKVRGRRRVLPHRNEPRALLPSFGPGDACISKHLDDLMPGALAPRSELTQLVVLVARQSAIERAETGEVPPHLGPDRCNPLFIARPDD